MKLRELYTTFIFEGVADVVKSLRATYSEPNQIDYINKNYEWIRNTFPKGAEWYMLLIGAHMSSDQAKLQKRLGGYAFTSVEQLQQDLAHFSTLGYQPINDYAFNNKTVKQVFNELTAFETKWKRLPSRPVVAQEGDRILKDYGNGIQWWFVDRGFCSEEGRSGKHCGNVTGQDKTDQRILSLRHNMNVVLTFIYLPDGRLGEMKAKGNQKPNEQYHSYIMDLLLGNLGIDVTGIKGAGWGPEFNFSIFDLNENNLNVIMQTKLSFVPEQIAATPRELLKAPDIIKNNPEYQQLAVSKQPAMQYFFVNGKVDNSHGAWERAIADESSYIIYAPVDIKNYRSRVIDQLIDYPNLFLESPRHIIKDEELVIEVVSKNASAIEYVPPAGITPKIAHIAVSNDGNVLEHVPEERRTPELCKTAVSNYGVALQFVPEELRTLELCKTAVSNSSWALQYVPEELRTLELCEIAVSNDGTALGDVPIELRTLKLCKTAVSNHGTALGDVPQELKTPEICNIAISNESAALRYFPIEYITPELCKAAVSRNGLALQNIPEELRTLELCKIAVSNKGNALQDVPEELRTLELCKIAVSNYGLALRDVPEELRIPEICNAAVSNYGLALQFVPEELKTLELCKLAVSTNGYALKFSPKEFKTFEVCKLAVSTNPFALNFTDDAQISSSQYDELKQITGKK
jgi:hypothetical protein